MNRLNGRVHRLELLAARLANSFSPDGRLTLLRAWEIALAAI